MPPPPNPSDRRAELLTDIQGRRIDEAYLHPSVRDNLEAEASDSDPDTLVTREMLDQLEEYMEQNEAAGVPPQVLLPTETAQSKAFFSTDAVIVVPGFLASSLSDTRRGGFGLIWFSLLRLFRTNSFGALRLGKYDDNEADLNPDVRIVSNGGLPVVYDLMRLALESLRYTTSTFGVDWRKDLELAARGLRDRIKDVIAQEYPVHLIAHSQGAMVARRALQLLKDEIGADAVKKDVKKLVLLGPANAGSFSAPLAISGDHDSIHTLRKLTHEPTSGFKDVFATMTGIYQLMPWDAARLPSLADPAHAIGDPAFWQSMPWIDTNRLTKFHGWARGIDTTFFNDRTTVILGDYDGKFGKKTSAEVAVVNGHLVVTGERPGDGTVPHCNAVLPGTTTFMAKDSDHTLLPTYRNVISALSCVISNPRPRNL